MYVEQANSYVPLEGENQHNCPRKRSATKSNRVEIDRIHPMTQQFQSVYTPERNSCMCAPGDRNKEVHNHIVCTADNRNVLHQ